MNNTTRIVVIDEEYDEGLEINQVIVAKRTIPIPSEDHNYTYACWCPLTDGRNLFDVNGLPFPILEGLDRVAEGERAHTPEIFAKAQEYLQRLKKAKSLTPENKVLKSTNKSVKQPQKRGRKPKTQKQDTEDWGDYTTRCLCGLTHNDDNMIQCDKCEVWQHMVCMRVPTGKPPDNYLCENCNPRNLKNSIDSAISIQKRWLKSKGMLNKNESTSEDNHNALQLKIGFFSEPTRLAKKGLFATSKGPNNKQSEKESMDNHQSTSLASSMPPPEFEELIDNVYSTRISSYISKLENKTTANTVQIAGLKKEPFARGMFVALNIKGLVSVKQIQTGSPIIEIMGHYWLFDEFLKSNTDISLDNPFLLTYSEGNFSEKKILVDARKQGNQARYVRRSCCPNANVKHIVQNGRVRLFIFALSNIGHSTEITIPFDVDYKTVEWSVVCSCNNDSCQIKMFYSSKTLDKAEQSHEADDKLITEVPVFQHSLNSQRNVKNSTREYSVEKGDTTGITSVSENKSRNINSSARVKKEDKVTDVNESIDTKLDDKVFSSTSTSEDIPQIKKKISLAKSLKAFSKAQRNEKISHVNRSLKRSKTISFDENSEDIKKKALESTHISTHTKDKKMDREERKLKAVMEQFQRKESLESKRYKKGSNKKHFNNGSEMQRPPMSNAEAAELLAQMKSMTPLQKNDLFDLDICKKLAEHARHISKLGIRDFHLPINFELNLIKEASQEMQAKPYSKTSPFIRTIKINDFVLPDSVKFLPSVPEEQCHSSAIEYDRSFSIFPFHVNEPTTSLTNSELDENFFPSSKSPDEDKVSGPLICDVESHEKCEPEKNISVNLDDHANEKLIEPKPSPQIKKEPKILSISEYKQRKQNKQSIENSNLANTEIKPSAENSNQSIFSSSVQTKRQSPRKSFIPNISESASATELFSKSNSAPTLNELKERILGGNKSTLQSFSNQPKQIPIEHEDEQHSAKNNSALVDLVDSRPPPPIDPNPRPSLEERLFEFRDQFGFVSPPTYVQTFLPNLVHPSKAPRRTSRFSSDKKILPPPVLTEPPTEHITGNTDGY